MNTDEANIIVPSWQIGSSLDPRSSLVSSYDSSSIVGWKGWTMKKEALIEEKELSAENLPSKEREKG